MTGYGALYSSDTCKHKPVAFYCVLYMVPSTKEHASDMSAIPLDQQGRAAASRQRIHAKREVQRDVENRVTAKLQRSCR